MFCEDCYLLGVKNISRSHAHKTVSLYLLQRFFFSHFQQAPPPFTPFYVEVPPPLPPGYRRHFRVPYLAPFLSLLLLPKQQCTKMNKRLSSLFPHFETKRSSDFLLRSKFNPKPTSKCLRIGQRHTCLSTKGRNFVLSSPLLNNACRRAPLSVSRICIWK